jgi:hypothetical protein
MNLIIRNTLIFSSFCFLTFSCNRTKKEENITTENYLIVNNADRKDKNSLIGNQLMKTESLGELKLGLVPKEITELIGKHEEKTVLEYFGHAGTYHEWKYKKKGILLTFVNELDSIPIVNRIEISEPCKLKTKKNIGIGSKIENVQIVYRNKIDTTKSDAKAIVVGTVLGGIIFEFENKKVKTIIIGPIAE